MLLLNPSTETIPLPMVYGAELECQISNLNREIELQSGGLLDQREAAVDPRHTLVSSKRVAKRQLLLASFARTSLCARREDTILFSY